MSSPDATPKYAFRFRPELKEQVEKIAGEQHVSLSAMIHMLLSNQIELIEQQKRRMREGDPVFGRSRPTNSGRF